MDLKLDLCELFGIRGFEAGQDDSQSAPTLFPADDRWGVGENGGDKGVDDARVGLTTCLIRLHLTHLIELLFPARQLDDHAELGMCAEAHDAFAAIEDRGVVFAGVVGPGGGEAADSAALGA